GVWVSGRSSGHRGGLVTAGRDAECPGEAATACLVGELQHAADIVVCVGLGVGADLLKVHAAGGVEPGRGRGDIAFAAGSGGEPVQRIAYEDALESISGRADPAARGSIIQAEEIADEVVGVAVVLNKALWFSGGGFTAQAG